MIVFAGIMPHPPLAIPVVGKDESKQVKKTISASLRLGGELAQAEPDTIIVISPHMVHFPHLFNILGMSNLYGSFSNFGTNEYEWHGRNDTELAREIADKSEEEGLPSILYDNKEGEYELDHGVSVPLYFLNQKLEYSAKVLPIGYSVASRSEHFAFGQVISEACEKRTRQRIAIIASGDLSHRLKLSSGEKYRGEEFDNELMSLIKRGDEFSILNMEEALVESAGECGYRSFLILIGALSGRDYEPKIYSYEGPFGVGYMVANMGLK